MKESAIVRYPGRTMALTALLVRLQRYQFIMTALLQVIRVVEFRCPNETRSHAARVGAYSAEIYAAWACQHGIPQTTIEGQKELLRIAAMLHDVGKIRIPQVILQKTGKLTAEEFEVMKHHTVLGAQFFVHARSEFGKMAIQVALNHHERWDGTGYPGHVDPEPGQILSEYEDEQGKPRRKQGNEIPLFGRVAAIADVYDALSSKRVYKEGWQEKNIFRELEEGAGRHFDPEIVDVFFANIERIRAIAQRFPEETP